MSELQKKIESQETNSKTREQEFESELKSHSDENNKLREEIKRLESSLVQIQEFKETIADMEHKLKELQSKLSGEENEKRILEQKYDEVSKRQVLKSMSFPVRPFHLSCIGFTDNINVMLFIQLLPLFTVYSNI